MKQAFCTLLIKTKVITIEHYLHEYIRAGNIGSLRSCAVSTNIRSGPLGVNTATKSERISSQVLIKL